MFVSGTRTHDYLIWGFEPMIFFILAIEPMIVSREDLNRNETSVLESGIEPMLMLKVKNWNYIWWNMITETKPMVKIGNWTHEHVYARYILLYFFFIDLSILYLGLGCGDSRPLWNGTSCLWSRTLFTRTPWIWLNLTAPENEKCTAGQFIRDWRF